MNRFRNRQDAGRRLAAALMSLVREQPVVLALPRGGVPVGYEIAHALSAPLDVWIVRKVGVPWQPELGIGAVAEGGYTHITEQVRAMTGLSDQELEALVEAKQREVEARVRRFRGDRPPPELRDRTVILVDDGIATGGSVRAAVASIRAQSPKRLVLAVPVAALDTVSSLSGEVDQFVCLVAPNLLYGIGLWYDDFSQVPDAEVAFILERARQEREQPRQVGV